MTAVVLAVVAVTAAALTCLAVAVTGDEQFVTLLALGPLVLGLLGIGLLTGRVGATAFGTGLLALLGAIALLGRTPSAAATVLVAGGVWLAAVAAHGSLLARVDDIDPGVGASITRWVLGVTVVGLGLAGASGWVAGRMDERSIGLEAVAAVAAVLVIVLLGAGLAGSDREEGAA